MKKKIIMLGVLCLVTGLAVAGYSKYIRKCGDDMRYLKSKVMFKEIVPINEIDASSLLAPDESPVLILENNKDKDPKKTVDKIVKRMEAQNYQKIVATYNYERRGNSVTTNICSDVASLCWDMRYKTAVVGYEEGKIYPTGYFLVPVPKSDKDAWMLGLSVKDMDYEDRQRVKRNTGVLITNVYDNSPAFSANFAVDYVITAVNGVLTNSVEEWKNATKGMAAGKTMTLTVAKTGSDQTFSGVITPRAVPAEKPRKSDLLAAPEIGGEDDMVLVEGDTFVWATSYNGKYKYEVQLDDFYMCRHEVTQEEYQKVMGINPSYWQGCDFFDAARMPVDSVKKEDAIAYCNKRSEMEGLKKCYDRKGRVNLSANGYRLPTDAEWYYAANGGKNYSGTVYAGSNDGNLVAQTPENAGIPRPVMQKKPNALGLYDLSGNVAELVYNKNGSSWSGAEDKFEKNPTGPAKYPSIFDERYLVRGGSAIMDTEGGETYENRRKYSHGIFQGTENIDYEPQNYIGFRVVRSKTK